MPERELFINAVQMVEVDGSSNVPTAVVYRSGGGVLIGNAALSEAEDLGVVNEDFKIDLGSPGLARIGVRAAARDAVDSM